MKTIDLREIPPRERHSYVFETFESLEAGDSMLLKIDHDPKPLYYQFKAEREREFSWNTLQSGPEVWEVSIGRNAHAQTVADVAREYPAAMAVFNEKQIDYCCHGNRPFSDAAADAGYSPDELLTLIRQSPAESKRLNYDHWSMTMLCDFIVENHHHYVNEKLPVLGALSGKVAHAHGETHPGLYGLRDLVEVLSHELASHMKKEEEELFPVIRSAEKSAFRELPELSRLTGLLQDEHDAAGALMKQIRKLTGNYTPPSDACGSFRLYYKELADFETDLFAHVHLENNILFPRVMEKLPAAGSA